MNIAAKTKIDASACAVWEVVRDFNGLGKFIPLVENSTQEGEGVGAIRTLYFPGGATTAEKLETLDELNRTVQYSIVGESPFVGYISTMSVRELDLHACEFEWSAAFEPQGINADEAKARLEGFYELGCAGLRKLFGR